MLTLQQILDSDSVSSLVSKLNLNFQSIALNGGGPQGLPGGQGMPGMPGRQGALGPTGSRGPTGSVVGIIPFASQTGGTTGPDSISGPWNSNSLNYLNNVIGTGTDKEGNIWIDHWNKGFWQYLTATNGTGGNYTESPYSEAYFGTYPPTGTGYYNKNGWYFYPLKDEGFNESDVWINDVTTYQNSKLDPGYLNFWPFEKGPLDEVNSTLKIKNARLLSKYGTVWISSGNGVNSDGVEDENNFITPTLYDWGGGLSGTSPSYFPQPGRYNAGVDRLYFKQSIDTLPYLSNVTARSFTFINNLTDPAIENVDYPNIRNQYIGGNDYWVKPLYSPSLDKFSPLQYYTERRNNAADYTNASVFGALGLYQFSSAGGVETATSSYKKSLFVYSTRTAKSPNDYTDDFPTPLSINDTYNIGEILMDVRKLTASNQFVCSTPEDLYRSSDYVVDYIYSEGDTNNIVKYTVTQGFVSSINGKSLIGNTDDISALNYGELGSSILGNNTRTSWYGSGAMGAPQQWSEYLNTDNPEGENVSETRISDKMYRIAGMRERGKKTFTNNANENQGEVNFLSELIFYTSQFNLIGEESIANSALNPIEFQNNQHNSLPVFYVSPFRNFGIGTFTQDDSGIFEPAAKFHVNASIRASDFDAGNINPVVTGRSNYDEYYKKSPYINYPSNIIKAGAFTQDYVTGSVPSYLDLYLGSTLPPLNEWSNSLNPPYDPFSDNNIEPSKNTQGNNLLTAAMRKESWTSLSTDRTASILRFGVAARANSSISTQAEDFQVEFPLALSPLNPNNDDSIGRMLTPVGIGIHNLYPRARVHLFGKNSNNEAQSGNGPHSPGFAVLANQSGSTGIQGLTGYYPGDEYAGQQIVIDYLEPKTDWLQTFNIGFNDYPYEAYGVVGATDLMGFRAAVGYSGSPNAANYPSRDSYAPTRTVTPWALDSRNSAAYSAVALNGSYTHGEVTDNLWNARHYIGFNLFRDLLNTGDTKGTTWRTGTTFDNGGSAIIGSNSGDLAFVNLSTARDGGLNYKTFEQQGLSTRDVLNNITMMMTKDGNVGIGNRPGQDWDAYLTERNTEYGVVNYVRTSAQGDARLVYPNPLTVYIGSTATMGSTSATNKPYGLISYAGLSGAYAESITTSPAAKINKAASKSEYVKLEVAAGKAYGKNSRSTLKAGYGYPPLQTINIEGSDIRNYLFLDWVGYEAAGGDIERFSISTDFEGRIEKITIRYFTEAGNIDFSPFYYALTLPHPTEFNDSSGTPWATTDFIATTGACAADLSDIINWDITTDFKLRFIHPKSFNQEYNQYANVRLNNFVLGEGMNVSPSQQFVRDQVKTARQQSPKLIFTFLEADGTTIPGSKSINTTETIGTNRPVSGTDPYRKVSTVIQSAQTESGLREYWIPKADNTGGTFMVFTDHYGQKEKSVGFGDSSTIVTSRFAVEEVITLEFVPSYTGVTAGSEYIASSISNSRNRTEKDAPMFVKYYNKLFGTTKNGITGTQKAEFSTLQYGRKVNPFGGYGGIMGDGGVEPSTGRGVNTYKYQANNLSGNFVQFRSPTATALTGRGGSITGCTATIITAPPMKTKGPVQITMTTDTEYLYSGAPASSRQINYQIRRNGIIVGPTAGRIDTPTQVPLVISFIDNPAPTQGNGTYTYSITASATLQPSDVVWFGLGRNGAVPSSVMNLPSISIVELGVTGTSAATGTTPSTGGTALALLRNVDKYYSVYDSATNWDNGWNNTEGFTNPSSQFRFKRINSEFALIDFNMTIQVTNPGIGYAGNPDTAPGLTLIDGGSPRWTQYVRLSYLPTKNIGPAGDDRDYFMKQFGNSLSFMNWSSFNQWYPGTAITSDPTGGLLAGDSLSETGGPNFTMGQEYDPSHTQNLVWSGNFYDATMTKTLGANDLTFGQTFGQPGLPAATYPNSSITPFYANDYYSGGLSRSLIWDDPYATPDNRENYNKSYAFGKYMGKAYSILGNDYLSKVRNCTWRVVPRIGTNSGDGVNNIGEVKNNSFTLEVMFDKPILHIDTPFADRNFSSVGSNGVVHPYQYLTVNGQAIVRYSDTTSTLLNAVIIGDQEWTDANLDVVTYSDGTPIPQITDPSDWYSTTTGAWSYFNNTPNQSTPSGKYYNHAAVLGIWNEASKTDPSLRKRLAPDGYHVPMESEWTTLINYLGGNANAGGKMRGTSGWGVTSSDELRAQSVWNNSSRFSALPGGWYDGYYVGWSYSPTEDTTAWWSSTVYYQPEVINDPNGYQYSYGSAIGISYFSTYVDTTSYRTDFATVAFPLRLIKDTELSTINIGNQTWTSANIDFETYSDGTPIPCAYDEITFATSTIGMWMYSTPIGGLKANKIYNYAAVAGIWNEPSKTNPSLRKRLAPDGYRVPSDEDWTVLTDYLGGASISAGKMRTIYDGWELSPDENFKPTNSSGFTAKAVSYYRHLDDGFGQTGERTGWWTSTESSVIIPGYGPDTYTSAYTRSIYYYDSIVSRNSTAIIEGYAVRLIKDVPNPQPPINPYLTPDVPGSSPPAPDPYSCSLADVTIGTQTWKACNLSVSEYRDGTPIPQVQDPTAWANLTTGAWCYHSNSTENGYIYGKLYNWYAVNNPKGLAPEGYHVPTTAEWTTLTTYVNGLPPAGNVGGKLKSTSTNWFTPGNTGPSGGNVGATNQVGFSAIPGGSRGFTGAFVSLNTNGRWWTSSRTTTPGKDPNVDSIARTMNANNTQVGVPDNNQKNGFSVRVIKD